MEPRTRLGYNEARRNYEPPSDHGGEGAVSGPIRIVGRTLAGLLAALLLGAPPAGAQGVIFTVAGSTWTFRGNGQTAANAPLGQTGGVTVDSSGNVFASDGGNHLVVKISPAGILTVVAGIGSAGFSGEGGPATSASLALPSAVAAITASAK